MGYNFLDDSLLSQLWSKILNTFALRSGTEGANVLWTNSGNTFPTDGTSDSETITLSESINNYKYIIIEYQQWNSYPTIETKIVENKNFGTTTSISSVFTILSFISSYNTTAGYPSYYYSRYFSTIADRPDQLRIYTCKGFGPDSFTTQDTDGKYKCLMPVRILGCNRVNFDTSITEVISNKVTSISSSSTDTQYPSALTVYNATHNRLFVCPNFTITHGPNLVIQDLNISATIPILTNRSTLPDTSSAITEKRSLGYFLDLYITSKGSTGGGLLTTTREIPVSGTYKENVGTVSEVSYQIVKLRASSQAITYTWTLIDSNGTSHSMPTGCTYTGMLNTAI